MIEWYLVLQVCLGYGEGYPVASKTRPCTVMEMPGGPFPLERLCHDAYGDLSKYARQLPLYMCLPRRTAGGGNARQ